MRCEEVMLTKVFTCREDQTIEACAQLMKSEFIGVVPIVDRKDAVVGIVTDRDLVVRGLATHKPASTALAEVMTRQPIVSCRREDDLTVLEAKMTNSQKSRIVVLDEKNRCVGIVSLSDLAHADDQTRAGGVLKAITRRESGMIARP